VGSTASGKSALALEVARRLGDVAKATPAEQAEVPHQLLDVAGPEEDYSLARFQADVAEVIAGVESRGRRALVVGGTGLYVQAVVDGLALPGQWPELKAALEDQPPADLHQRLTELDPLAASRIQPGNTRRLVRALEVTLGSGQPFSSFGPGLDAYPPSRRFRMAGVWLPRPALAVRIEARYRDQLAAGFLDEVLRLQDRMSRTARQALGYKELLAHLGGECPLDDAVAAAVSRTREFARRQRAWFRRDPRITWLGAPANPFDVLPALLGDWSSP
jgi:tRNA dimethylallyltransferase